MNLNQFNYKLGKLLKRAGRWLLSVFRSIKDKLLNRYVPNDDSGESDHVTTSNLEQHRKQILDRARRHVKPQTTTHSNVVRYSIVIGLASVLLIIAGLFISVYRLQPTNNFYYRVAQIIPIPVGEVDGHNIRYDRVLFYYRAESRTEELSNLTTPSQPDQLERLERSFMKARESTYILQLADRQNVSVSDEELEAIISNLPLVDSGTSDLDAVIQQLRGWTRDDLYRETRIEALKTTKVLASDLFSLSRARSGAEFNRISDELGESVASQGTLEELGEDAPQQLQQLAEQAADNKALNPVATDDGIYFAFKTSAQQVDYVYVEQAVRQSLLQQQIAEASSISCFSDVSFDLVEINIEPEQRYTKCLF